mgnify:CR=1 FL=1
MEFLFFLVKNKMEKDHGKCQWTDEKKKDAKGSNCLEYLVLKIFFQGLHK